MELSKVEEEEQDDMGNKSPYTQKLHDKISVRIRRIDPYCKAKGRYIGNNISHFTLAFMCQFPIPK